MEGARRGTLTGVILPPSPSVEFLVLVVKKYYVDCYYVTPVFTCIEYQVLKVFLLADTSPLAQLGSPNF